MRHLLGPALFSGWGVRTLAGLDIPGRWGRADAETSWHRGGSAHHQPQRHRDFDSDEYPLYGQQHGHGQYGRKKRRGFLEELFD